MKIRLVTIGVLLGFVFVVGNVVIKQRRAERDCLTRGGTPIATGGHAGPTCLEKEPAK